MQRSQPEKVLKFVTNTPDFRMEIVCFYSETEKRFYCDLVVEDKESGKREVVERFIELASPLLTRDVVYEVVREWLKQVKAEYTKKT